jgi:glutaminyl-tRNA synthetase
VIKDASGHIVEILATYDPETKSGSGFDARKPNGTIHFVSAHHAIKTQFNLFGPLVFDGETPFMERLNPESWIKKYGYIEAAFNESLPTKSFQLMRVGYFTFDKLSTKDNVQLNRIVELKSSFQK